MKYKTKIITVVILFTFLFNLNIFALVADNGSNSHDFIPTIGVDNDYILENYGIIIESIEGFSIQENLKQSNIPNGTNNR